MRNLSIGEKVKIYSEYEYEKRRNYVLSLNFDELGWDIKREYLIFESNNTCDKCGTREWLNNTIVLEINHINGNNKDHRKENLECLCPNCHSVTKNWRGRNKRNKRSKLTNQELLKHLLLNDWNMRKSLIEAGLTPKGGNYKRCHKIKREYEEFGGIVSELSIINKPTKEEFIAVLDKFDLYVDVADYYGVSKSTITSWCDDYGVKKIKKSKIPNEMELINDLKKLKYYTAVGRKYGVSDNAIRKRVIKYGYNPKTLKKE